MRSARVGLRVLRLPQLAGKLTRSQACLENNALPYRSVDRVHCQPKIGELQMSRRKQWDNYFMDIAEAASSRSTCDRLHVGAVIVRNKTLISTGYNGSISGLPHCDEADHIIENGHCTRTVHAEANAIVQAAKNGSSTDGCTMYVTASPCWECFKLIANSGIKRIVFGKFYRDEKIFRAAEAVGIKLDRIDKTGE